MFINNRLKSELQMDETTLNIKIALDIILQGSAPIIIELGCGDKKEAFLDDGRIGIDRVDLAHVDIVADLEKGLSFLSDNSVDEIHARSLFEHINNFDLLLKEILRVLKDDGCCRLMVPHFSNPYYYSDPTHVRFFGLYSFYYYCHEKRQLSRKVPTFYTESRLEITSLKLRFRSSFKGRKWWKKLHEKIFNLSPSLQEFYEENLCYLFPCYGIAIEFRPDRSVDRSQR